MLCNVAVHPRACLPVLWSCDWPSSYIPLGWEARLTALQSASPLQRANRWVNTGFHIYSTWPQACTKFIENSSAQTINWRSMTPFGYSCIHIYIYIERERERETSACIQFFFHLYFIYMNESQYFKDHTHSKNSKTFHYSSYGWNIHSNKTRTHKWQSCGKAYMLICSKCWEKLDDLFLFISLSPSPSTFSRDAVWL